MKKIIKNDDLLKIGNIDIISNVGSGKTEAIISNFILPAINNNMPTIYLSGKGDRTPAETIYWICENNNKKEDFVIVDFGAALSGGFTHTLNCPIIKESKELSLLFDSLLLNTDDKFSFALKKIFKNTKPDLTIDEIIEKSKILVIILPSMQYSYNVNKTLIHLFEKLINMHLKITNKPSLVCYDDIDKHDIDSFNTFPIHTIVKSNTNIALSNFTTKEVQSNLINNNTILLSSTKNYCISKRSNKALLFNKKTKKITKLIFKNDLNEKINIGIEIKLHRYN